MANSNLQVLTPGLTGRVSATVESTADQTLLRGIEVLNAWNKRDQYVRDLAPALLGNVLSGMQMRGENLDAHANDAADLAISAASRLYDKLSKPIP